MTTIRTWALALAALCVAVVPAEASRRTTVAHLELANGPGPLLLPRDGAVAVVERGAAELRVTSFDDASGRLEPLRITGRLLAAADRRLLVLGGDRLRVVGAVTGRDLASWPLKSTFEQMTVTQSSGWWLVRAGGQGHLIQQRTQWRRVVRLPGPPTSEARLVADGRGDVLIALDGTGPDAGRFWLTRPTTGASVELTSRPVAVVDNLLFLSSSREPGGGEAATVVTAEQTGAYPSLFPVGPRRRWDVPPPVRTTVKSGRALRLEGVVWSDQGRFYLFSGRKGTPVFNIDRRAWQPLATHVRLFRLLAEPTSLERIMRHGGLTGGPPRYQLTSSLLIEALGDRVNVYDRPSYTLRASVALPFARSYVFAEVPNGLLLATAQENGVVRLTGARLTFSRLHW